LQLEIDIGGIIIMKKLLLLLCIGISSLYALDQEAETLATMTCTQASSFYEDTSALLNNMVENPVDVDGWRAIGETVEPIITSKVEAAQSIAEKVIAHGQKHIGVARKTAKIIYGALFGKKLEGGLEPLPVKVATEASVTPALSTPEVITAPVAPVAIAPEVQTPAAVVPLAKIEIQSNAGLLAHAMAHANKPASTWAEKFDNATFGDTRREALNYAKELAGQAREQAAQAADYISERAGEAQVCWNETIVPAIGKTAEATKNGLVMTKNGVVEVCSATKDAICVVGNAVLGTGKFAYNHPEVSVSLAAVVAARVAYLNYVLPGMLIKECRKLDQFITYPTQAVNDTAIADIPKIKNDLLWRAGIYYRTKYAPSLSQRFYAEEIRDITAFCDCLTAAKASRAAVSTLPAAALKVKIILKRRLSLDDARLVA